MINVKLMHELLNEMKSYLIHSNHSLAHALTQLRIQINDIEKIMFNHEQNDSDVSKNMDKLHNVASKVNTFKYQYNALCERFENLMRTIDSVSCNHKLFENHFLHELATESAFNPCANDSLEMLQRKKEEEQAKRAAAELQEKLQKAKNDLLLQNEARIPDAEEHY